MFFDNKSLWMILGPFAFPSGAHFTFGNDFQQDLFLKFLNLQNILRNWSYLICTDSFTMFLVTVVGWSFGFSVTDLAMGDDFVRWRMLGVASALLKRLGKFLALYSFSL